jgi:hypothetical protein
MSKSDNHAQLIISVSRLVEGTSITAVKAELNGCKNCLVTAITNLLLCDNDFKELINKSIRSANEIKGRTQN